MLYYYLTYTILVLLGLHTATDELDWLLFTYAPALAPPPLFDEDAHATAVSTFFAILVINWLLCQLNIQESQLLEI